ncbi:hypothetical protein BGX28_005895 [Mortierella sp. GBA30]|nr:hypothetical protein BGX28_005895 [Mortierella sp. GBA30]
MATTTITATTRRSTRLATKAEKKAEPAPAPSTVAATPVAPVAKKAAPKHAKSKEPVKVKEEPVTQPARKRRVKNDPPFDSTKPKQKRRKQAYTDDDIAIAAAPEKPVRRKRQSTKQRSTVREETQNRGPSTSTSLLREVNHSDPCVMLPTEIWHQVLSRLPLSQAASSSLVSKTWLDGARDWPVWKHICEEKQLGKPKRKYKTHMALVCAHSYFICEKCYSYTNGTRQYYASEIPLPVDVIVKKGRRRKNKGKDTAESSNSSQVTSQSDVPAQNQTNDEINDESNDQSKDKGKETASDNVVERWILCKDCRVKYYDRYPEEYMRLPGESENDWEYRRSDRITKTRACAAYHLSEDDISDLDCREVRNPHYRSWYPMRLYDRFDIQDRALVVHGGWVGVDAYTKGIAKKRRVAFKLREAAVIESSGQSRKRRASQGAFTQEATQASQEATQASQEALVPKIEEQATQIIDYGKLVIPSLDTTSTMPSVSQDPITASALGIPAGVTVPAVVQ